MNGDISDWQAKHTNDAAAASAESLLNSFDTFVSCPQGILINMPVSGRLKVSIVER
jgi:hypothetical protein